MLILGANPETVGLIQSARSLGVEVFVTDGNPNAHAKKYSDRSFDIDALDLDGLISLIKSENIDGIIVGVADSLLFSYFKVCEIMEFPCYVSGEQLRIFTDKQLFNDMLNLFDLEGIPQIYIKNNGSVPKIEENKFPVLVKPVDGNSGKGISICRSPNEIDTAIQKAISNSKSKRFMVEEVMNYDNVGIYYTFLKGKIYLSGMFDRYTLDQGSHSRVCVGALYPSKKLENYINKYHDKMISLFKYLNVSNGVFLICAFVDDEKFYFYDPGFRLQGESVDIYLENFAKFNQREMLIELAMGNEPLDEGLRGVVIPQAWRGFAVTVWLLVSEGKISRIEGINSLTNNENILSVVQRYYVGDEIISEAVGTERQVFARIYIYSKNKTDLKKEVINIFKNVKVYGENNKSILIDTSDLLLFNM